MEQIRQVVAEKQNVLKSSAKLKTLVSYLSQKCGKKSQFLDFTVSTQFIWFSLMIVCQVTGRRCIAPSMQDNI